MEIKCPSGFAGKVRGLTVHEAEMLADRKAARAGEVVSNILSAVWGGMTNAGPYEIADGNSIPWGSLLVADRFYCVMMVRVATYGSDFEFKLPCSNCQEPINWCVDLQELPVREVPEESLVTFSKGNRFSTDLHGTKVWFRLVDGALEAKLQRAMKGTKNRMTVLLSNRILEVEGVKNKVRWIRDLPMASGLALLDAFDEADGGIDTDIEIECDSCGAILPVALPFDRAEFWLPSKTARTL